MNIYDACELAYRNGYEAGRNSMANQCVMCGAEMPEGGHICAKCADGAVQPNRFAQVITPPPKPNTELSFGAKNKTNYGVKNMKSFSKALAIMWFINAGLNLLVWATCGFDFDKLLICLLECTIALYNWKDYKREE